MINFSKSCALAAFIATLGASEALAFCGETDQIVTESAVVELAEETAKSGASGAVKAMPLTAPYVIKNQQTDAMSEVAGDEYKTRLRDYLRYVWWEDGGNKTNAELEEIVEKAIEICESFDECPETAIREVAIIYLVEPSTLDPDWVWERARLDENDTGWWNLFTLRFLTTINNRLRDLYFYRLNLMHPDHSIENWIEIRNNYKDYDGPEGPYVGD